MDRRFVLSRDVAGSRLDELRGLLREYEAAISVSLDFQDFEREVMSFPEGYVPPEGCVIVAREAQSGELAGLVCVRRLSPGCCEMKRLYVRPGARGHGLGGRLASAAMDDARQLGYGRMRLDTLPEMTEAASLYLSRGFCEIDNYNRNPVAGARFFEADL